MFVCNQVSIVVSDTNEQYLARIKLVARCIQKHMYKDLKFCNIVVPDEDAASKNLVGAMRQFSNLDLDCKISIEIVALCLNEISFSVLEEEMKRVHKNKKDSHTRMMRKLVDCDVENELLPEDAQYASSDDENDIHGGVYSFSSTSSSVPSKNSKKTDACRHEKKLIESKNSVGGNDAENESHFDMSAPGGTYPGETDKMGRVLLSNKEYAIRLEGQGFDAGTIQQVLGTKTDMEALGRRPGWFKKSLGIAVESSGLVGKKKALPQGNYHAAQNSGTRDAEAEAVNEQQYLEEERRRAQEHTDSWTSCLTSCASSKVMYLQL